MTLRYAMVPHLSNLPVRPPSLDVLTEPNSSGGRKTEH